MTLRETRGVIFVIPRSSRAWRGAEALWITVGGWASAAKRLRGAAWVVTSDRIAEPEEVVDYPLADNRKPRQPGGKSILSLVPQVVKVAWKDFKLWKESRLMSVVLTEAPWCTTKVEFVWEQHDLFHGPGRKIAHQLGVPLVMFVHAPVVWEAARWGVRRPFWGKILEHFYEASSLKKADVVACVSEEVARVVARMGVDPNRIVVSPMSVDLSRFSEQALNSGTKHSFGLQDKFVIGWTGSFRGFHGLDTLVKVFSTVLKSKPNAFLMLVGDGAEKQAIENLVAELDIERHVLFVGRVPFTKIPHYVSVFDIAVVSASNAENFHYSPLKLREYMIARKPTLAPRAGEVPILFKEGEQLLLYTVGNLLEMSTKILQLMDDASLRKELGENGFNQVHETGTWDFELKKILKLLNIA